MRAGLFLSFLLHCFNLSAQSCSFTLSGLVADAHDAAPLPYAVVSITELNISVVSDSSGRYRIEGLCAGLYHIECTHLGCEPVHAVIKLNKSTVLDLKPEHHVNELSTALVSGVRLTDRMMSERSAIDRKSIEMSHGYSLAEMLRDVQGVQTLQTGSTIVKPMIRGMQGNRILIFNHGIRQEAQQWGNEHAPEIDPMTAGALTVIKGAGATRYGSDAIGGVIIADPLPLRDSCGTDGLLNLAGASNGRMGSASAMIQTRLHRLPQLALRAQGTLKKAGNVHTPGYILANTGTEERNFSWLASYGTKARGIEVFYSQFNARVGIFSGAHIGNLGDLKRAFESDTPLVADVFRYDISRPRQEIVHELARAKAWWHSPNTGKWLLTYGRQYNMRKEYDKHIPLNDSLAGLDLPSLQFEITTPTLELLQEHRLGKSITGSVGMNGMFQFNTYEGRFFIPNFRKWNAGLFLIEKWRSPDGRNELEAGLRYDQTSQQIFMWEGQNLMQPLFLYRGFSGNLSFSRQLSDALSLSFQSGYSWRPPHVSEMFSNGIHHGTASYERGDAGLSPEAVLGNSMNLDWKGSRMRFSGEAYYNFFDNMIFLNPELPPVLTIRGAFPSFAYRQTEARHYGATAGFFYEVFPFLSVEMNGSLLRAFTKQGYFLPLMPADRSEVALHLSLDKGSLHEKTFAIRLSRVNKQWRADPLSDFIPPPGAYMLVGLESGINFHIGAQPVRVGLEVRNLFNASYREYLDRLRYYTNSTGTNLMFRLSIPLNIQNHKKSEQ